MSQIPTAAPTYTTTPTSSGSGLRVSFIVQGEGRGHMTQALALAEMLRAAGHDVVSVLLGRSRYRSVPGYFLDHIGAPVTYFSAPVQVPDTRRRGVSVPRTTINSVLRLPAFVAGGVRIEREIQSSRADVVVNFYDFVGGLAHVVLQSATPSVAIAHNYVFLHPAYHPLPGGAWAQGSFMGMSRGTWIGSGVRLALSYAPLAPDPRQDLRVVPPLLRPELLDLTPEPGSHLVAYALNSGYADLLATWHRSRRPGPLHCFVEGGGRALTEDPPPGFHVQELDDIEFLNSLASCAGYIGSAGFEAVSEAYFLGKPTLAFPTEGQYEQRLNAWDAERHHAARSGSYGTALADLDAFMDDPPMPDRERLSAFRKWVSAAATYVVPVIEEAARLR